MRLCFNLMKGNKKASIVKTRMINNGKLKQRGIKKKITIYHFEEQADDRIKIRKNDFSSKNKNNDDEVDAITIRKYYEK